MSTLRRYARASSSSQSAVLLPLVRAWPPSPTAGVNSCIHQQRCLSSSSSLPRCRFTTTIAPPSHGARRIPCSYFSSSSSSCFSSSSFLASSTSIPSTSPSSLTASNTSPSARHSSTMAEQTKLKEALANNEAWASSTHTSTPDFFAESAKGQAPKLLWLGCSDSRVPESTILNLPPGAVFTHRNIANIFTASDLSSLSVIEYAVAAVGVQHVVVCGHTGCGGVAAALANRHIGVIDAWLQPLRALRGRLVRAGRLGEGVSDADKSLALVEENVREGVRTVRSNPNVIRAARDRGLTVHGLVYELGTGRLRELTVEEDEEDVKARIEACTCD